MTASAIAWSLGLCSTHSSEKLLPYLCISDEPFECYDNNITWYMMQWVKRETVDKDFSPGFPETEVMALFWRYFPRIIESFWGASSLSPEGKGPHPTAGTWTVSKWPSPVVVPLSSPSPRSAHAGFPLVFAWHTRVFFLLLFGWVFLSDSFWYHF